MQFIDARDLAGWTLAAVEARLAGTFNASSPQGRWTMGSLVAALVDGARAAGLATAPEWIDEATLVEHGVVPWTGLPLWIPATEPNSAGFMLISCARAVAEGLRFRALGETIGDTATWLANP